MSGALGRAMEKMGWRASDGGYDDYDDQYDHASVQSNESPSQLPIVSRPEVVASRYDHGGALDEKVRIRSVAPSSYAEAKPFAEAYRDGIPVIIELSNLSEDEKRRIVDFCAGITFGLHGAVESINNSVILLSPASVRVETEKSAPRQPF